MSTEIQIIMPQFDRTWELDYEYIPQTESDFYSTISNAPTETLIGMGFGKWSTLSELVKDNASKPKVRIVEIPIINADGIFRFDTGRGDAPIELPGYDAEVLLFPKEWYNHIPNGFMVTGLSGEQYPFEIGKSDDDTRFGCLPYGILRRI